MSRTAPITLFCILAVFLGIGLTRDPGAIPTQMLDRPLPDFSLPSLQDETVHISPDDLAGEIILLNVFGSWCVACLQEHGLLMRIAEDDRVRLVGVNWRDTREDPSAWLEKQGNPYEAVFFDANSDLVIELGVTGAPETFLVDSSGRIRYKHVGPVMPDDWQNMLRPQVAALHSAEAGL